MSARPAPLRRPLTLALALALALLAGFTLPAFAQDAEPEVTVPPTIIAFSVDIPSITLDNLEAGETTGTFLWHVVGLQEAQRVVLERYELNAFRSLLNADETTLPASGTRELPIVPSTTFAPPTYRLSILDFRNRIIDQHIVVIPVDDPSGDVTIDTFVTPVESIDIAALEAGDLRVNITWAITNRPLHANPVFEQVYDDGQILLAELPRSFIWIPSSGSGTVAPLPDGSDTIRLRMSVVDQTDGTVYAQEDLTIPVIGGEQATPEATAESTPDTTTEPMGEATQEAIVTQITAFSATPESIFVGENVQLMWQVSGAASVQIAVQTPASEALQVIASNLPLNAGLTIPVTESTFAGVESVTFTLRALDSTGAILAEQSASVAISAPA